MSTYGRPYERIAAHVAVAASEAAIDRVARSFPSARLDDAMSIARTLQKELDGRRDGGPTFRKLADLRRWSERKPDPVRAAVASLATANEAVLAHTLHTDPTVPAGQAIERAVEAGIGRAEIDEIVRLARFR